MRGERSIGPIVEREERVALLIAELRRLTRRRDALDTWLPLNVSAPDWEAKLRDQQVLIQRIDTLHRRLGNVRSGIPELGYEVPTKDYTRYHRSRTS